MSTQVDFVSFEDRVDNLIQETKLREEAEAKARRQKDRVMILQEKDIVKSLVSEKASSTKRMKNFFKVGVAAGVAALGLATVAPVAAAVAGVAAGFALFKAKKKHDETNSIEEDVKVAKKNVNTLLATLQGGKAGVYQITKRIADCRKNLNLQGMNTEVKILPSMR